MSLRHVATLAILLCSAQALATDQQVNPNTYKALGVQPKYGRSDGLFLYAPTGQTPAPRIPLFVGNGDGFSPVPGPAFRENFKAWGDGDGLTCYAVARTGTVGFTPAASANQACDTTCGNSACVIGFEASLDAAADILTCADATADACICQTTSLDEVLVGCGANWEAPALGLTAIDMNDGIRFGHVSLLAEDIGPDMDANGLDIAGDQTNNDGVEMFTGVPWVSSGRPFYPGDDPAFYFCATVRISHLNGSDNLYFGFRDVTVPNAVHASYNSYAAVAITSADGDWKTVTEDDGGGTTTTDITNGVLVADTETKICNFVSDAGVWTCTIDGAACTTQASYTFDLGEGVIPYISFLHDTNVLDEFHIAVWEQGWQ